MRKIFLVVVIIVVPFFGRTHNDSAVVVNDERLVDGVGNQVDLDFEFLAVSCGVRFQVNEKWQMGPSFGFGCGFVLGVRKQESGDGFYGFGGGELFNVGLTFGYLCSDKLVFEVEPKISGMILGAGSFGFGFGAGLLSFSGFYGKKVQIGLRATLGLTTSEYARGGFVSSSFLIVRVPLKRW